MRNIEIEELGATPITGRKVEVVERKGLGHPDYICDSIMNNVSVQLCREYMEKFGAIVHHNIDKGMLVAGGEKQIRRRRDSQAHAHHFRGQGYVRG